MRNCWHGEVSPLKIKNPSHGICLQRPYRETGMEGLGPHSCGGLFVSQLLAINNINMFNFFHNLGLGFISAFIAVTGIFHQAPPVDTSTPPIQTGVSSIVETLPTSSVATPVVKQKVDKTVTSVNSLKMQDQIQAEVQTRLKIKEKADADAQVLLKVKADQDALITKQKANEQAKVDAQKTLSSVKNVDKGTPYQGQSGNWYYPNAFNSDGSALQAPSASINGSTTIDLNLPVTSDGQYFNVKMQTFVISNQTNISRLSKLIVHFKTSGDIKITTAYLYQGDSLPLASAMVSNDGTVTFAIPNGVIGSNLGVNIPTQFTVSADLVGITKPIGCWTYWRDPYKNINIKDKYYESMGVSSFSIQSFINPVDVGIYDDSSDPVKIIGSAYGSVTQPQTSCRSEGSA